jgi:hypothetical protein
MLNNLDNHKCKIQKWASRIYDSIRIKVKIKSPLIWMKQMMISHLIHQEDLAIKIFKIKNKIYYIIIKM